MELNKRYGMELIIDMHKCDVSLFNQEKIGRYFVELCDLIEMKRHGEPLFWEDHCDIPHLCGTSAIQFIETSNVVIHTLNILEAVYINIFSCKTFKEEDAISFSKEYFGAQEISFKVFDRI